MKRALLLLLALSLLAGCQKKPQTPAEELDAALAANPTQGCWNPMVKQILHGMLMDNINTEFGDKGSSPVLDDLIDAPKVITLHDVSMTGYDDKADKLSCLAFYDVVMQTKEHGNIGIPGSSIHFDVIHSESGREVHFHPSEFQSFVDLLNKKLLPFNVQIALDNPPDKQ